MAFRNRFFTPQVARAIMSPSGIAIAGVGTALGVATGLPVIGAALIGAGAWAARVGVSIPRGPVKERIDRRTVSGSWQQFVDEAQDAKRRFETATDRTSEGPVKDRLVGVGAQIDRFVDRSYRVAQSGQQLTEARSYIDVRGIVSELAEVQKGGQPAPGSTQEQAVASLKAQLQSAERMDATIAETRAQLMLLDARLDELVTRTIELSVTGGDAHSLGSVDRELQGVVDELEAVRLAVGEVG